MPRTLMGRFLLASMLRHKSESDRLSARFNNFGSLASAHVMIAAFEIAVGHLFEPEVDLEEISIFVSDMRRGFGSDVPSLETEALIRHMLGEDVVIGDLSVKTKTAAMIFTLMAWADLQQRDETKVTHLVCEAERRALARGHQPELA
ncbi:hypothetical protein ABZ744_31465 [Micromonospora chersina]|uniref:hypothetical protein n=1 Tax=Micromonospora chersina TaxID=47854 RepID=UPI0033CCEB77